jgi:transposase
MCATEVEIPCGIFNFSGQSSIETYAIDIEEIRSYDDISVDRTRLCFEAIRKLSNDFSCWQHRARTGRPPVEERTLLIAFLVRQHFNATFRNTEGILRHLSEYFEIEAVPDHTSLSRKNKCRRWLTIWRRFHAYVLSLLPKRKAIIATDSIGYSGRNDSWRETDYGIRAIQDWVKVHAAIEVDSFVVLSYTLSKSKVHDSRRYGRVWNNLPDNVRPIRSLADTAYTGEACLQTALSHGTTPYHGIKKNARFFKHPKTAYESMTNFAAHWPNRYAELYGKRNHAESVFSAIVRLFGHRLRCRSKIGRMNEVQAKLSMYNISILAKNFVL